MLNKKRKDAIDDLSENNPTWTVQSGDINKEQFYISTRRSGSIFIKLINVEDSYFEKTATSSDMGRSTTIISICDDEDTTNGACHLFSGIEYNIDSQRVVVDLCASGRKLNKYVATGLVDRMSPISVR